MSMEAIREKLADVFATGMAISNPGLPIAWENQPFKRPNRAPWVDFRVNFGDSAPMEIGVGRQRLEGVINVQIMVPEDSGTKVLNDISDNVVALLANRSWALGGDDGKLKTCGVQNRSRQNNAAFAVRSVMVEFSNDYR